MSIFTMFEVSCVYLAGDCSSSRHIQLLTLAMSLSWSIIQGKGQFSKDANQSQLLGGYFEGLDHGVLPYAQYRAPAVHLQGRIWDLST